MNSFESLGLNEQIIKSITELGFTSPTPIQEKAIPVLLSGTKDFVGLAQTGTGKTAAFGLPLLQLINISDKFPQALIVCPTRELCLSRITSTTLPFFPLSDPEMTITLSPFRRKGFGIFLSLVAFFVLIALAIAILGQSNYFWCEGYDTHVIALPELTGYRAEYAGSPWLIRCVQQYHGIVIKADI